MIQHFLNYLAKEKRYSSQTVDAYRRDIIHYCEYLQKEPEDLQIEDLTETDIKGWMMEQLGRNLKPRSVNRRLSSLRTLCKFLLRTGIITTDPTHRIISPKIDKPLPVFYRESEMKRALQEEYTADDYPSVRDNLILEMLYQTGMRSAEILHLKDEDIDISEKQINVFGKRSKERLVPIGDALTEMIQNYWNYRNEVFPDNPQHLFLLSNKGTEYKKGQLYRLVKTRMSEVSTHKKQSPHVLRHTFATTMLNNGADINTIKELLGHANLAATEIYTHTTFEQIQQVYQQAHPRAKK